MQCTACGWPLAETSVVSAHRTSEGLVCYQRCVCGRITIRLRPPRRAAGGQRLAG
ncbi:MAG TPA: hypothetical protein VGH72_10000 [Pseudonocardia sp.]